MSAAFLPGNPMAGTLHAELRSLIAASRQRLAGAVNAELTRLYWTLGERLSSEVLGGERAAYGQRLMERLGEQLSAEFGRGFDFKNLRRMVRFAELFPAAEIDASVMRQLSWTREGRHHRGRILDRTAAESRTGAAVAPDADTSAGTAGAAWHLAGE